MQQCPVCNGLVSLHEHCTFCGHYLSDLGSQIDLSGPYRPYREDDLASNICSHVLHCPQCGRSITWPVPEMRC